LYRHGPHSGDECQNRKDVSQYVTKPNGASPPFPGLAQPSGRLAHILQYFLFYVKFLSPPNSGAFLPLRPFHAFALYRKRKKGYNNNPKLSLRMLIHGA
jgi:hypothetical protein